tara:strand:+ start:7363 stop:7515 length:153 start_codon:yes stop_codon:yes gene_type:complete
MEQIFDLLMLSKKFKLTGRYIGIALGKNKLPESPTEAYRIFERELWQSEL